MRSLCNGSLKKYYFHERKWKIVVGVPVMVATRGPMRVSCGHVMRFAGFDLLT